MSAEAAGQTGTGMLDRKVIRPVLDLLRQGITPEKIALSIAIGAALGVFPLVGTTTILCALAAAVLGLNLPAIQLVNYLVYPVQLALLLPFMRLGELVSGPGTAPLIPARVLGQVRSNPWQAAVILWDALERAMLAWLITVPLTALLLYLTLAPLLRRIRTKPA